MPINMSFIYGPCGREYRYIQVQQQTGTNPDAPAPSGPSRQKYRPPNNRLPRTRHKPREDERVGPREVRSEGRSLGGIVGDAGKGAAIGAVGGTMRGGRKRHQANEQSQQQAAQSAGAQMQRQSNQA